MKGWKGSAATLTIQPLTSLLRSQLYSKSIRITCTFDYVIFTICSLYYFDLVSCVLSLYYFVYLQGIQVEIN